MKKHKVEDISKAVDHYVQALINSRKGDQHAVYFALGALKAHLVEATAGYPADLEYLQKQTRELCEVIGD